jgi:hypothetical protein
MTEASNIPSRVERIENDTIDMKVAISALISTTEIHQRNIETMNRNTEIHQRNIETMNRNIEAMFQIMTQSLQRMEIMELDIRGLQTENRRILDILQQRNTDET